MNNISNFQQYLRSTNAFTRFGLKKIGVFGSFARDEANSNDIDILIEDDVDPEKLIVLKNELEQLFHRKIDVVLKKFANPIILYRAQKDLQYASPH